MSDLKSQLKGYGTDDMINNTINCIEKKTKWDDLLNGCTAFNPIINPYSIKDIVNKYYEGHSHTAVSTPAPSSSSSSLPPPRPPSSLPPPRPSSSSASLLYHNNYNELIQIYDDINELAKKGTKITITEESRPTGPMSYAFDGQHAPETWLVYKTNNYQTVLKEVRKKDAKELIEKASKKGGKRKSRRNQKNKKSRKKLRKSNRRR